MSGSAGMDVAWQDSGVGSFLDSSGTDPMSFASFTSDGGALWSSSADSPLFSSQAVLWESGADAPADSHISGLTADGTGGNDTSALLAGSWIADAGAGFAGGSAALDGGLLWTGASSDTSSTLTNNGGVGLGALDLGATSGASQWQQFVDQFAGGSATGLAEIPHLLWTGPSSQPVVTLPVSVPDSSQSIHLAASDSLALPTVGSLSPTQLVFTEASAAPSLSSGPGLAGAQTTLATGAAPTTFSQSLGGPVQPPSGLPASMGGTG